MRAAEETWREKYAQLKVCDVRHEARGIFIVEVGVGLALQEWWIHAIGLNPELHLSWKKALLEKDGIYFNLDGVLAALDESKIAVRESMVHRAKLKKEKEARLLRGPDKK